MFLILVQKEIIPHCFPQHHAPGKVVVSCSPSSSSWQHSDGQVWQPEARHVVSASEQGWSPAGEVRFTVFTFVLLVCQGTSFVVLKLLWMLALSCQKLDQDNQLTSPFFNNHDSELRSTLLFASVGGPGGMLANLWPLVRGTNQPTFLSSCLLVDLHSQKCLRNNSQQSTDEQHQDSLSTHHVSIGLLCRIEV